MEESEDLNGRASESWFSVLTRRRIPLIVCPLVTVTVALGLSSMQEPIYQAGGSMIVEVNQNNTVFGSNAQSMVNPDRKLQNEILVVQGDVVYNRVRTNLGLDGFPPGVSAIASDSADLVGVFVQSPDAQTAAILANAYMSAYTEVKRDGSVARFDQKIAEVSAKVTELQRQIAALDAVIDAAPTDEDTTARADRRSLVDQQISFQTTLDQLQIDAALQTGGAAVVQPAGIPVEPIKPTPVKTGILALIAGLGLGVGAAFLLHALDNSIKRPDDLLRIAGAPVLLATIRAIDAPDQRPMALSSPTDGSVEAYRVLRTNVQFLQLDREMKVIQFTSAVAGEGKTTTATNLAVVLAQSGADVIIVDADLRRPFVHKAFAIPATNGLTTSLIGGNPAVQPVMLDAHLWALPSGPLPPNPSEVLSSRGAAQLIQVLRERFDYVIIDSPPVLLVSDALAMSRHADGLIMVVQAGRVTVPQIKKALAALEQVGAPTLGIVLNKVKDRDLRAEGDYSYGYEYTPAKS
ncbi:MAG: polysaccharide biosynthesis tyrosine autokinase [Ilumatobacteraceae bacterium]